MKKRIFSRVLALVMALSLLSTTAFAASFSQLQDAIDGTGDDTSNYIADTGRYGYAWNAGLNHWDIEAWDDNGTRNVQLNEDVAHKGTTESPIQIDNGQNVNLDLNGNTIDGTGDNPTYQSFTIKVTGEDTSLTLKNDKDTGSLSAGKYAGGVFVEDGASFTMESGKILNCSGKNVSVTDGGSFVMKDGEISGGNLGVFVSGEDSTFTMENGKISENGLRGVSVKDGAVFTMNGGSISENRSGGVSADGATFNMYGGNITENTSSSGGGIFATNHSTINLTAGSEKEINISKNVSSGSAGGIYINGDNNLTIDGAVISENQAKGLGGGIFIYSENVTADIRNTTMLDNKAGQDGSALRAHSKVNITNSTISNTTEPDVYTIWVGPNGNVTLSNTTLTNGSAQAAHGGAIHMGEGAAISNGHISLTPVEYESFEMGGTFESNGFKVHLSGGNVTITDANGNAVEAVLDANGTRLSAGTLEPETCINLVLPLRAIPAPVVPGDEENPSDPGFGGVIDGVGFAPDATATTADTTTIEDEETPLAGLISTAELLEALREYEGIEDVELPEDFQWADHDYAQAIYWGLEEALVIDTEDAPLDPDEIVTIALLREVLENFVAYKGLTDFPVTVEGEDDMIVMDLGERLTAFLGELEAALAFKAA